MQLLHQYILEKLKLTKNIKSVDYEELYGKGEIKSWDDCEFPFEDILQTSELKELREDLRLYLFDEVYFIKFNGSNLSRCTELSENFKQALRYCPKCNIEKISTYEPGANIRIYCLDNYPQKEKNETTHAVVQCQNWSDDIPKTYWYIKIR